MPPNQRSYACDSKISLSLPVEYKLKTYTMNLLQKIFKKETEIREVDQSKVENFMTLIRVYYQSVMAVNLGVTNIRFLPDVALFKHVYKVPTQGGRLGAAEKNHSRKLLMQGYGLSEGFFKEIDASIKKNCRTQNDIKNYLFMFQGFSSDLMMLVSNLMKWKFATPKIFRKAFYTMTEQSIHTILTRTNWKSDDARPVARNVRAYKEKLGYSEGWMTEYVFNIVMLAKSEKRRKKTDE